MILVKVKVKGVCSYHTCALFLPGKQSGLETDGLSAKAGHNKASKYVTSFK